jgi:hypothetical protein
LLLAQNVEPNEPSCREQPKGDWFSVLEMRVKHDRFERTRNHCRQRFRKSPMPQAKSGQKWATARNPVQMPLAFFARPWPFCRKGLGGWRVYPACSPAGTGAAGAISAEFDATACGEPKAGLCSSQSARQQPAPML